MSTREMGAILRLAPFLAFSLLLALARPCASDQMLFSYASFALQDASHFSGVNGAHIDNASRSIHITTHNSNNPNNTFTSSAFWYKEMVRGESFKTSFVLRMTNNTFVPGLGYRDGIAFVIQTQGINAVGPPTGGIGYGTNGAGSTGIRRSVAVEFDTYKDDDLLDPTRNHYQVHTLGAEPNSANISAAVSDHKNEPFFNDNNPHTVEILYADGSLTITVDGALEPMVVALDLDKLIGPIAPNGVFVGFTGATQGVGETQEILSWSYLYLGKTDAANSVAYGPGMGASVAGEAATFTIQAVDQFGYNITTGDTGNFSVTIAPAASSDTTTAAAPVTVNVTDNEDGTYSVSYVATTATTYTVHATFNGTDIKGSPWTMTLEPATVSPAQCTAAGSLNGGTAGDVLTLEVQARDAYGNNVGKAYPGAHFEARFSNGFEANFTEEGAGGLYKAQYSIDLQGLYSFEVFFVVNGSSTPIEGSPWDNCTIVAADPSALECYATGEGLEMAVAGASGNFSLVARDRFNNTLYGGLPPAFAFSATITHAQGATAPVTIAKVDNGTAAHYVATYAATTAGNYTLDVFLSPPDNTHIAGSPFLISVIPANSTWGPECVAYGDGLDGGSVGQARSFVIQARDPFGNNMTDSNANFTVVFTQRAGDAAMAVSMAGGEVAYNITQDPTDKGKFVVSYATTVAAHYSIAVSLDDKPIKGSPFSATVVPGALDAADCIARGTGLSGQTEKKDLTFTISTFDIYGNALWKGGALFLVNVSDRFNGFAGKGKVEDLDTGIYRVTYSVPQAGHYRLSVTTGGVHIRASPWFFSIGGESMPETEKNLIIAGSVIGAVLLLAFVVGLVILFVRRRRNQYTVLA